MVESRGDPSKLNNWEAVSGASEAHETLDAFRDILKGSKTEFLSAGGYTAETAAETVTKYGGGVVFGRIFISSEYSLDLDCDGD
jgi:NADPH2 dehydrogenase